MYEGEVLVLWRAKYASDALSFRLIAFATSLPEGGEGTTSISIYYAFIDKKQSPAQGGAGDYFCNLETHSFQRGSA